MPVNIFREEKKQETEKNLQQQAINKTLSGFGQLVFLLVWKMVKRFSVYIGLSEGIELITKDQKNS
jgi:hypothetical protein